MSTKVTVLCRFKHGIILRGPSPVRHAFDASLGHAPAPKHSHLELQYGVNEDIDLHEIEAWVQRAADAGLTVRPLPAC
jgi:hypothetical protein